MLPARDHAARICTAVASGEAAQSQLVASWSRCIGGYGLDPMRAQPPHILTAAELRNSVEEMDEILFAARAALERLHAVSQGTKACILFAGQSGILVHSSVPLSDAAELHRLGLHPGVDWNEQTEGTNGIGTCLVEKSPLLIHKEQHFYERHMSVSCAAAPIFDHVGEIAGALDVTIYGPDTDGTWPAHMVSLVAETARQIEIDYFHQKFSAARIISVAGRSSRSGAALLAVDGDDVVVGATRGARTALKLTDRQLREGICARDLFDNTPDDLSQAERSIIRRALVRSKGNVSAAANLLNISRATMKRKLAYYDLRKKS